MSTAALLKRPVPEAGFVHVEPRLLPAFLDFPTRRRRRWAVDLSIGNTFVPDRDRV